MLIIRRCAYLSLTALTFGKITSAIGLDSRAVKLASDFKMGPLHISHWDTLYMNIIIIFVDSMKIMINQVTLIVKCLLGNKR